MESADTPPNSLKCRGQGQNWFADLVCLGDVLLAVRALNGKASLDALTSSRHA